VVFPIFTNPSIEGLIRIFGDFSGWVGAEREKAFRVTAIGTA
jgi:hypothetical protein